MNQGIEDNISYDERSLADFGRRWRVLAVTLMGLLAGAATGFALGGSGGAIFGTPTGAIIFVLTIWMARFRGESESHIVFVLGLVVAVSVVSSACMYVLGWPWPTICAVAAIIVVVTWNLTCAVRRLASRISSDVSG